MGLRGEIIDRIRAQTNTVRGGNVMVKMDGQIGVRTYYRSEDDATTKRATIDLAQVFLVIIFVTV